MVTQGSIPYGQKTHLRFQGRGVYPTEGSCRFPLMVLEQTTQPFLATHNSVIPARPSIRQGEEEPVLLALVIALLEFLVYGSGDLRKHASPNHSRASLNLIVEPGLYMLLSSQKASCARKYETGSKAFSIRFRFLTIRQQLLPRLPPNTLVFPPPQTPPAGHAAGILGGQVAPTSPGAQHPENAFHALPVRCPGSAPSVAPPLGLGKQILNQFPLPVSQPHANS